MARRRTSSTRELPPPLPPEQRTVGQLVAESIRLYGATFARALPLGIVVAVVNQLTFDLSTVEAAIVLVAATPFFTLAYIWASQLATDTRVPARAWLVPFAVGVVVWVPAALLIPWFKLACVLWLALVGLAVPAAVVERTSFTRALRRGLALGRVDYVHAGGSLAVLVLLFGVSSVVLALLLESQADNTVRTAVFLADALLAPLLFLGGALLYVDQDARLRSREVEARGEERHADVPDADDADREGRPDAAREPRPSS